MFSGSLKSIVPTWLYISYWKVDDWNSQPTLFPSFAALETTQAELFDLKTKYDEESTAKYVSWWYMRVFAGDFSPLAPPYSVPDIIILFSGSPCLETPPSLPNSWIVSHNARQNPNPSITQRTVNTDRDCNAFCSHSSTEIGIFCVWCRLKHSLIHQGPEEEEKLTRVALRSLTKSHAGF